jgi:hypothetical protein
MVGRGFWVLLLGWLTVTVLGGFFANWPFCFDKFHVPWGPVGSVGVPRRIYAN